MEKNQNNAWNLKTSAENIGGGGCLKTNKGTL